MFTTNIYIDYGNPFKITSDQKKNDPALGVVCRVHGVSDIKLTCFIQRVS